MTWWDEVRDACLAEQSACDATGGTPFDAWPVLLPIAAVVATVGLGIRVVVLMREGGETEGVARSVSDPPANRGVAEPGGFAAPDEGVGAVPGASREAGAGWWGR